MRHLPWLVLILAACGEPAQPGRQRATASPQSGPRTLISRPLMSTSPQNLLRDPAVGANSGFLDAGAFFALPVIPNQQAANFLSSSQLVLTHTFQSASPIGGTAAVTELRNPSGRSSAQTGAQILCSFMGGPGAFHASVWLSAGDADAAPVPFATAENALSVWLLGVDGSNKVQLLPAETTVTYGNREWIQYSTPGDAAFPFYGWLSIELTNLRLSLQLASPEVTSSALGGPSTGLAAPRVAMSPQDLRLLARAQASDPRALDPAHPRTRRFPRPDRAPR